MTRCVAPPVFGHGPGSLRVLPFTLRHAPLDQCGAAGVAGHIRPLLERLPGVWSGIRGDLEGFLELLGAAATS
jgi:hypothetical protein